MNLLIDLGNSRLKWAAATPDAWQVHNVPARDPSTVIDQNWRELPPPNKTVIASVADRERLDSLTQWIEQHWSLTPHVLKSQSEQLGVKNCYFEPGQLGADRWAALIAARHMISSSACVVDCGTAVTVDTLSPAGEFLGGVIFPGLGLLRASLIQATAGLRSETGDERQCPARSTADGIASGTLFGLAGAIDRVLEEVQRSLDLPLSILITGGDAPVLAPRLKASVTEIPDLVLRGLARVAESL